MASSFVATIAAKPQVPDADIIAAKALAERIIPDRSTSFEFRKLKSGKKAADCFSLSSENGKIVVEDTKGLRTKDYIIKRKLMLYVHNIRIREV